MGLLIAATVGATSSGTGNDARAEWFRMKSAWSLYRLSDAQFFYARYAYFQCSEDRAPQCGERAHVAQRGLRHRLPLSAGQQRRDRDWLHWRCPVARHFRWWTR
ncbi:hypothetical protein MTO96_041541 [Rhipicephalus appendiculatus]